nr:glycosyltransferase [Lolliginicoccus lacisalsi]
MPQRWLAAIGASTAAGLLAIAVVNAATAPRARPGIGRRRPVSVCIPARNERHTLPSLIMDLQQQDTSHDFRVLILDDASTDGTGAAALEAIGSDPRFELRASEEEPPPGWVGKQWACQRLAEHAMARPGVLLFLDADVRLSPSAVDSAVLALESSSADLVSIWPFQAAGSLVEHLIQPLLAWSWLALVPVRLANENLRPSLSIACGQFMATSTDAYRAVGGHARIRGSLVDDLDLAREYRAKGRKTAVVLGGPAASCRMYCSARTLREGYGRWLGHAFGGRTSTTLVLAGIAATQMLPVLLVRARDPRTRALARGGYACLVASRLVAGQVEQGARLQCARIVSAVAHPAAAAGVIALVLDSRVRHRRGQATWRQRPLRLP